MSGFGLETSCCCPPYLCLQDRRVVVYGRVAGGTFTLPGMELPFQHSSMISSHTHLLEHRTRRAHRGTGAEKTGEDRETRDDVPFQRTSDLPEKIGLDPTLPIARENAVFQLHGFCV